eukprot:COSAG05_NODE_2181_length_3431_cov_16.118697_3_plen_76_part_00
MRVVLSTRQCQLTWAVDCRIVSSNEGGEEESIPLVSCLSPLCLNLLPGNLDQLTMYEFYPDQVRYNFNLLAMIMS